LGYFANASQIEHYMSAYCYECTHHNADYENMGLSDADNCPVIDMHLLSREMKHMEEISRLLELFIPYDRETGNLPCMMYAKEFEE
jgi:hypothetical protein